MAAGWITRATVPLDAARRSAFRVTVRHPRISALITRRDLRLALLASAQAAIAFGLAVFCPVLLLVLGPILFGVAHVAADVRHLVLRRHLPARAQQLAWACGLGLVGLRGLAELHLLPFGLDGAEWALATGWAAAFAVLGGASGRSPGRAALGVLLACGLGAAALSDPARARLVFVQAHNVVALVLWVALFRRRRRSVALPLALVALGTLLLGSGKLYGLTLQHGQTTAFGTHVVAASDWLAPGLRVDRAIGLTSAFVFLQSVHYAVWLLYVPQDDQPFESTRSFRASVRALHRDFGGVWLGVIAAAGAAVVAFGLLDAIRVRHLYLSLAMFHGYLELALMAYFWARGGALRGSPA